MVTSRYSTEENKSANTVRRSAQNERIIIYSCVLLFFPFSLSFVTYLLT